VCACACVGVGGFFFFFTLDNPFLQQALGVNGQTDLIIKRNYVCRDLFVTRE
jgi:hypothetical protein